MQGLANIPEGQFTSNDAYLYYWQADIITKHGTLPARDMHRWLPLGRDLGQTLNLYSYATAYAYKLVTVFFLIPKPVDPQEQFLQTISDLVNFSS